MSRTLVVFEHVPKTAGSTIRTILWQIYGGPAVFMATTPGEYPQRVALLQDRLADPNNCLRVILSHAGYGLHERLPGGYRFQHFTMLREPIDRTISHYYYQIQRDRLDARISMEDFIRADLSRSCNVQTAFLGGLEVQRTVDERPLSLSDFTPDLLERAKSALRNHLAVGLTERFDESLLLYQRAFGWPYRNILYLRHNTGKKRPKKDAATPTQLKLIREYNQLDLELYAYGQQLFEEQLAQYVPQAAQQLARFRTANAWYGRVYPALEPVIDWLRKLRGLDIEARRAERRAARKATEAASVQDAPHP